MGHDKQVGLELPGKLLQVADIVHPLVEAAGELRGDGLRRDLLQRQQAEDAQQLLRALRGFCLVHRDLHRKATIRARRRDLFIKRLGRLDGRAVNRHQTGRAHRIKDNRLHARHRNRSQVLQRLTVAGGIRLARRRLAEAVGDIQGEEIAAGDEGVHRLYRDMVGINKVRPAVAQRLHRRIRLVAEALRLRPDQGVLPLALVPYRGHVHPQCLCVQHGTQLRFSLATKTVAHPKCESR